MPRVALVATDSTAEGPDLLAARLRHLLRMGWDARLFCKGERFAGAPALADSTLDPQIELVSERSRQVPSPSLLRRPITFARYLRSGGEAVPFGGRLLALRPDLVHYHSGSAGSRGIRLKSLQGCRVVVTCREDGEDLHVPDPKVLWDGADLLLFPSQAVLERAAGLGCPRHKAELLHPPLLIGDAGTPGRRPEAGPLRILSAGPLTWEQGIEHSVHAVRLLLDKGIECQYRILGRGHHLTAVEFARHELNLAGHVRLIEPDGGDLLTREMLAADVLVDAAVTDTVSPAPLIMAQALGVPFVATLRDGMPEGAGIAVARRNARAIAAGLATLARDPGLRRRMGRVGRTEPPRYPTLADNVRELEKLYWRALR